VVTLSEGAEQLREALFQAVCADLLGPASGQTEELVCSSVRDRYLVGQLAPRGMKLRPEENDDLGGAGADSSEESGGEMDSAPVTSLMPSSLGLTVSVAGAANSISVAASWGAYAKTKSDVKVTPAGESMSVWQRSPRGGRMELPLRDGEFERTAPDANVPDVTLEGRIRRQGDDWIVTVFLVNGRPELDSNADEAWLFQPELAVTSANGDAVFTKRGLVELTSAGDPADAAERETLAMLYRDHVEFAVGHGVAVHAEVDPDCPQQAYSVQTRVAPWYDVPNVEAPTADDSGFEGLGGLELDMKVLASMPTPDLVATLEVLHAQYEKWIGDHGAAADHLGQYSDAGKQALEECRHASSRLAEGIHVLEASEDAADAFRFANAAMHLQRVHSDLAQRRRRGDESLSIEMVDVPENRRWRPFQLAFVVLALAGVSDPTHPDRVDPVGATADLLWFPTGGGKTEAYLGVAAYVMGLRRLQHDLGGLDASAGVSVIMRYTLRLLTIQQFQRATALTCAMEVIRREEELKWGKEPFRIGLWVGGRATPNRTADSETAIKNDKGDQYSPTGRGTPFQLTNCPWCGKPLELGRDLRVDRDLQRTLMFCSDRLGRCEFTARKAPGEGIPAVVVDEEIYRLLPTLLIGTVDKFAQMPWKGEVQALFGRVDGRCLRHGFLNGESDDTGKHQRKGHLPAVERADAGPLRPPDLIIQDELHLISGPLGTMVGLYETAVDRLCEWDYDGKRVRPKVIASTATIRRARDQVHGLFSRRVEVFPPRGIDIRDNFFSLERPLSSGHPGRRYFGICAPGKSRPAVLIRVYVALLTAAQALYAVHGMDADTWMTLVGYFNSLRELGGMRRLVEDDVATRAFRVQMKNELDRPGLAQRDVAVIEELTSRKSSSDIPRILDWLEQPFDPTEDEKRRAKAADKKQRPLDVLLATNMVSVGVDVGRLGLMAVAGQPKTTAEYIQATSRVGRRTPGLVCAILNWARPRDLSHFERFEHFHATFYQHVEALSVTPFAPRAMDRGLTGVLVSLMRLENDLLTPNQGAGRLDRSGAYVDPTVAAIARRAENVSSESVTRQQVEEILAERLDQWSHEAQMPSRILGYKREKGGSTVPLLEAAGAGGWQPFTLLNSLRDVEPTSNLVMRGGQPEHPNDWTAPLPQQGGAK
jgi:hypothetical protein